MELRRLEGGRKLTNSVITSAEPRHAGPNFRPGARLKSVLKTLGIESRLQLAITICVLALVLVTPIESGAAPVVVLVYRSLLLAITILCGIGSWRQDLRISRVFLTLLGLALFLALISVSRIQGSHFEGLFLWYRLAFFIAGFLALAHYNKYQSARWKELLLGIVVAGNIIYLIAGLVTNHRPVASFSNNPNYFATFMLTGTAASLAVAVFGTRPAWRIAAGASAVFLLFGITQTDSRGGVLAAGLVVLVAAIRGGSRIPRHVWMLIALAGLVTMLVASPYLIRKFVDRGESDPYNYARTTIWMDAVKVIAENPILGVGFGQFMNASKRFAFPVQGVVARYLKRAGIAHSEYLQYFAEMGIPATLLLLSLFGYLVFLAWKRSKTTWPEFRSFQEAAILVTVGLGAHALVDNCWTIPVMTSGLVVLSLSDLLPLAGAGLSRRSDRAPAKAGAYIGGHIGAYVLAAGFSLLVVAVYVHSTVLPSIGLYYNDIGHKAFEKGDIATAERNHLRAVAIRPDGLCSSTTWEWCICNGPRIRRPETPFRPPQSTSPGRSLRIRLRSIPTFTWRPCSFDRLPEIPRRTGKSTSSSSTTTENFWRSILSSRFPGRTSPSLILRSESMSELSRSSTEPSNTNRIMFPVTCSSQPGIASWETSPKASAANARRSRSSTNIGTFNPPNPTKASCSAGPKPPGPRRRSLSKRNSL